MSHLQPNTDAVPHEPSPVHIRFYENLPKKPFCANNLELGLSIKPKRRAIEFSYIQPNFPKIVHYLPFDVDREAATFDWEEAHLPAPTFIVINPNNGHCHYLYELDRAVLLWDRASQKPVKFLDAIRRAYIDALDTD